MLDQCVIHNASTAETRVHVVGHPTNIHGQHTHTHRQTAVITAALHGGSVYLILPTATPCRGHLCLTGVYCRPISAEPLEEQADGGTVRSVTQCVPWVELLQNR